MATIKYHPLINDDKSPDMIPMFFTTNEDNISTKYYLFEFISNYYRLCSKESVNNAKAEIQKIHCPYCGKEMTSIAPPINNHRHSLYTCKICKTNNCQEEEEE